VTRRISEQVTHEAYIGTGEDAHGNPIDTYAASVQVGIYAFDPGGTSEPALPGQDRVITTPRLLVPESVVMHPQDRVTVRGTRYEVDGETLVYSNPHDSSMDGNQVNLKAVTG
jgi:hypothetical protein